MMTKLKAPRAPVPTEAQECIKFVQWLSAKKILHAHIPNEGKRNPWTGKLLQKMGMVKGVSDFFIPHPTAVRHGLWIEMKRTDKRANSKPLEQIEWIVKMRANGYEAEFAYGADEAIQIVERYFLIKE